jgi:hypothetical protein
MLRWALVAMALAGGASAGCAQRSSVQPRYADLRLPDGSAVLPARVRRLTNLELERSVEALTGLDADLAAQLPADVRQDGYTPNAAQDVSAAWATQYSRLMRDLAKTAVEQRGSSLAPCAPNDAQPSAADVDGCVRETVRSLGLRAYRRPLAAEEQALLQSAFAEGAGDGRGFAEGLSLLLRALLESPSFMYLSELGQAAPAGTRVRLEEYEIASLLSYTLRGAPPDAALLDAAANARLADPNARIAQARRLLAMSDTRHQFRRFAIEWLEVDGLAHTAKNSAQYPAYDVLKPFMLAETENYVDEVMVRGGASVRGLLASGFASVGPEMARFYGLKSYGARASLSGSGRSGVLQQASFLAAHAHEDVTSPVKRGDFVMRKLLCQKIQRPAEIGLEVVMPPPSNKLTNRERMGVHASEPGCASCHTTLDALGFTFESFDAMGALQTRDRGKPVDTRVEVRLGEHGSRAVPIERIDSSVELSAALAEREDVAECFARHAFRYFSAQSDPALEAAFVALRRQLPAGARDNLFNALLGYVGSELFVLREVKPG